MHTLQELSEVNLLTLGYILELEPDDEEKAMLEQNIQVALQQNQIYLEDAIDIREVKNLKLANQLLKQRRKKKQNKIKLRNKQIFKHKLKLMPSKLREQL